MARRLFPSEGSRLVYGISGPYLAHRVSSSTVLYADEALTTLADVRVHNANDTVGTAYTGSAVPADTTSNLPDFYGPDDDSDTLFYDRGAGLVGVVRSNEDDRLDALEGTLAGNVLSLSALDPSLDFAPDGVTDNSAAWDRLAALLSAPGNHVYFPPGTYYTAISGTSAFVPTHDVLIEGAGDATVFTTDVATATGSLVAPTAAIRVHVRNVKVIGSRASTSVDTLFVNHGSVAAGAELEVENVTLEGSWGEAIKACSAQTGTTPMVLRRIRADIVGTVALHAGGPGGSCLVEDSEFLSWGVPGTNLYHAIYCSSDVDLRVTSGCRFISTVGLGFAIQHFGGTGAAKVAEVAHSYFGPNCHRAITNYATVPMRVVDCDLAAGMASGSSLWVTKDMDVVDCRIGTPLIITSSSATPTVRVLGGESTVATALITTTFPAVLEIGARHRLRGLATTGSPFSLAGGAVGTTTRSIGEVSYGASGATASTTANRPSAADFGPGGRWFDTTLGRPIASDGAAWVVPPASIAPDVQVFTANGTWTKPAGATMVQITLIAGGGGGGSGRRGAAGTLRTAGAAGAGGAMTRVLVPASALSATENVVVGAGGVGGAAVTADDTDGNPGTAGASTTFGTSVRVRCQAGGLGAGGNATGAAAGGSGGSGDFQGSNGASSSATGGGGSSGSSSNGSASGGGAGGGITTGNTATSGGAGGPTNSFNGTGALGGTAGAAGADGAASPITYGPGNGGGGGASSTSAPSGAGGNGGPYGAGGGGGAASVNGNNSGKGGNGAGGLAVISTW